MPKLLTVMELDHLDIIPSYTCNSANCIDCYQKTSKEYHESCKHTIDLDLLIPFLRKYISTIKVNSFGLFGGECTDYDRCCELVSMLTGEFPGIRLEIVSNGQNHVIIGKIIEAANKRHNLVLEFSIDGYGKVCDFLRGKDGYFSEVILSIEEMSKRGLASNIHINTRYYPEHEETIIEMSNFLYDTYGITRNDISLQNVICRGATNRDVNQYISALREFARKFWSNSCPINLPRSHPMYKPYDSKRTTVFCVPGIQPDGYLYTCNNYKYGMSVGHISEEDVIGLVTKMLNISKLNPEQCDKCLFGQCVLNHYFFQQS